jgi:hypothetical protein
MANLEILALDTAVPQIRAPGVGDGYSAPRSITMGSGTTLSAQTLTATKLTAQTLTVGLGGQTAISTNTAMGFEALDSASLSGAENVAVGYQALRATTSGNNNVAVGKTTLLSNTTGIGNSAVGSLSLYFNTDGDYNSALGSFALFQTTGDRNTGLGYFTLINNTTGNNNIAIGYQAGDAITTGSTNLVIGHDIDVDSATGSNQINIGGRYFHDRISLLERSADPAKPAEGNCIVWMSDGTGLGDDGDVIIASTVSGVTNYAILFDYSAGTVWP